MSSFCLGGRISNSFCTDMITIAVLTIACVVNASSYFIHLSDPHLDFNYKEGSSTDCALHDIGFPCCHDWSANLSPCDTAPRFGHKNCDLPRETGQLVIEAIAKDFPNPSFVLLTGDLTSHDAFYEYAKHIAEKWDWMFTQIKSYFGENVKIISTIGNHDVYPADQVSDNITDEAITAIFNVMQQHGVLHAGVPDEDIFSLHGYYKTALPNSNIDAIVMNNIIDLYQNRMTDPNNRDPGGMYSWMHKAISESVAAKRKVWLVGHVAPSYEMELTRGVSVIQRLLDEFGSNVITGMFYGHTHMDEFMLTGMQSLQDHAQNVAILAPAMIPRGYINPSARVVEVDGDDLTLVDWHQYRMNLDKSNKENKFIFGKAYTFREHFEVPDLSPKSFQAISQRTLVDEQYALKYLNTRATFHMNDTCDEICRRYVYCLTSFRESFDLFDACNSTDINTLIKTFHN